MLGTPRKLAALACAMALLEPALGGAGTHRRPARKGQHHPERPARRARPTARDHGTRGIAAKVFGAIPDMNVRMISQGASEINISFVIEEDDVPHAVQSLHRAFFSDVDAEIFGEAGK